MPDVRLIDANAVLKEMKKTYCTDCNNYNGVCCRACEHMDDMDFIEDAPTVDAQPVKHGRWIKVDGKYGGNFGCKCSNCGKRIRYANSSSKISKNGFYWYCPNCGAYMGGDADVKENV